jgi:L-fuconolactonase
MTATSQTRREFLQRASAGLAALAVEPLTTAAERETIPAIDAHTHFYDPSRPQGVPWPGKDDKRLYRPVLPDEFKELTKKQHVRATIIVEASPWVEDNQWLLDLAKKDKFIVGVVGNLDPASDDFAKHLERFARDPVFRGIRINHGDLRKGLDSKKYLENLGLLAKHDRALDVNGGPDMPADVAKLRKELRDLRIAINHAANVKIDGKKPPEEWLKGMKAAAEGERVYCKVSALVEGTVRKKGEPPPELDFYHPILDALWETFGEDRLIYGSNWPVCDAPYARVYEIVDSYFRKRGRIATSKSFEGNAMMAYKLVEHKQ